MHKTQHISMNTQQANISMNTQQANKPNNMTN